MTTPGREICLISEPKLAAVGEIHVRVVPAFNEDGLIDLSGPGFVERFEDRVGELGDAVHRISAMMREQFDRVDSAPPIGSAWAIDEISLSFTLDLEAEAGVVLAKAKSSAGFEVQFRWNRQPRAD